LCFKLHSAFQIGEISREELEKLLIDVIKDEAPEAIIITIVYNKSGVSVQTDLGPIEIEIDWNEIIIKENK